MRLLTAGASAADVAAASADAAQRGFHAASNDEGVLEAFHLLTMLPNAARQADAAAAIQQLLPVSAQPTLVEVASAVADVLEERAAGRGTRSDFGEMAMLAAVETLGDVVGARLPRLFGRPEPADVRQALAHFGTERQFGVLARAFFTRFTERYLKSFLSRELAKHVGEGRSLATTDDHIRFNEAIRRHCFETARIVEDFAGEWMSKNRWQGGLTAEKSRGFTGHALTKLGAELRKRDERGDG